MSEDSLMLSVCVCVGIDDASEVRHTRSVLHPCTYPVASGRPTATATARSGPGPSRGGTPAAPPAAAAPAGRAEARHGLLLSWPFSASLPAATCLTADCCPCLLAPQCRLPLGPPARQSVLPRRQGGAASLQHTPNRACVLLAPHSAGGEDREGLGGLPRTGSRRLPACGGVRRELNG